MRALEKWASVAVINLGIVAVLGFIMRSKLIFPLPAIDFKFTLHAHSHFAFGGWVTLALMALMIYRLLPSQVYNKPVYWWLLFATQVNALGMLVTFLYQGYALFSIIFSVLFILVTYAFAAVFIKDLVKTPTNGPVKSLAIAATVYLVLSSVGPFTLAYLLASKSPNVVLYKDSIYTYLHLQYSGFFTLAVFSLLLNRFAVQNQRINMFARLLNFSVIPSMFISYLWHYPALWIKLIAITGSLSLLAATVWFFLMIPSLRRSWATIHPLVRKLAVLSMASFILKMLFQAMTIIPTLGPLVFANRPVIIGFLHLVLLGFVSLYILAHFAEIGLIRLNKTGQFGLWLFVTGIVLNELVLMGQGLGFMFMIASSVMQWLLWAAAICLMLGAIVLACNNIGKLTISPNSFRIKRTFSQS